MKSILEGQPSFFIIFLFTLVFMASCFQFQSKIFGCAISDPQNPISKCLICQKGFSKDIETSLCRQSDSFFPGCQLNQGNVCLSCDCGYGMNVGGTNCIESQQTNLRNCAKFFDNDNKQCGQCNSSEVADYGLSTTKEKCDDNQLGIRHCAQYTFNNGVRICDVCHQGYGLSEKGLCVTVKREIFRCLRYDETGQFCKQCINGLTQNKDSTYCYYNKGDCGFPLSDYECETCIDPNKDVDTIGRCFDKIENCQQLFSQFECLTCNDGYVLNELRDQCMFVIEGCLTPLSSIQCRICQPNYGISITAQCISNSPATGGVLNCQEYQMPSPTTYSCKICLEGYILTVDQTYCAQIPEFCQKIFPVNTNTDIVYCMTCIQPEKYGLTPYYRCVQKIDHCDIPSGPYSCQKCIDEYGVMVDETCKQNQKFRQDPGGVFNCQQYMSNSISCLQCIEGCSLDEDNLCKCADITQTCVKYEVSGSTYICLKCIYGYLPNQDGTKCIKILDSAALKQWNYLCTNVLDANSARCVKCKQGYAPNGQYDVLGNIVTIIQKGQFCFKLSLKCQNQSENFLTCSDQVPDDLCDLTESDEKCLRCKESESNYGLLQNQCVYNDPNQGLISKCLDYYPYDPLVTNCRKCFKGFYGQGKNGNPAQIITETLNTIDQKKVCLSFVFDGLSNGIQFCDSFEGTKCQQCIEGYVPTSDQKKCIRILTNINYCQFGFYEATSSTDPTPQEDLCEQCYQTVDIDAVYDSTNKICLQNLVPIFHLFDFQALFSNSSLLSFFPICKPPPQVKYCKIYQTLGGILLPPSNFFCNECFQGLQPTADFNSCIPKFPAFLSFCQIPDSTGTYCLQCLPLKVISQDQKKCYTIENDPNCIISIAEQRCGQCIQPYIVSDQFQCVLPVLNCKNPATTNKCSETMCIKGFIYLPDTKRCLINSIKQCLTFSIDPIALEYDPAKSICSQCYKDFTLTFDRKGCVYSIEFCEKLLVDGTCGKCQPTYGLRVDQLRCLQKIQNCDTYSVDENKCITCVPQVKGKDMSLIGIGSGCSGSVAFCTRYLDSSRCANCAQGYLITEDFSCESAIEGCIEYDSRIENCLQCQDNLVLSVDSKNCFIPIPFCSQYSLIGECDKCEDTNLDDLIRIPNSLKQNCVLVPVYCSSAMLDTSNPLKDSYICSDCQYGYGLTPQKVCSNVIPFCTQYTVVETSLVCAKCEDGFGISEDQLNCRFNFDACGIPSCLTYSKSSGFDDIQCIKFDSTLDEAPTSTSSTIIATPSVITDTNSTNTNSSTTAATSGANVSSMIVNLTRNLILMTVLFKILS